MSKTMKIGIAGGRGLSTMMGFNAIEGVEVAALCDPDEELLKSKSEQYLIACGPPFGQLLQMIIGGVIGIV